MTIFGESKIRGKVALYLWLGYLLRASIDGLPATVVVRHRSLSSFTLEDIESYRSAPNVSLSVSAYDVQTAWVAGGPRVSSLMLVGTKSAKSRLFLALNRDKPPRTGLCSPVVISGMI